jgi:hypothetical protein
MEVDGVFLDVRFDRKEILIDEGRDFIVSIGFGLQPNARASRGSSAEVEQQGLLVSLCLSECRINVFVPLNSNFRASLRLIKHGVAIPYQPRSCLTPRFSGRATTCASGKLSTRDLLIPVRCKRLLCFGNT